MPTAQDAVNRFPRTTKLSDHWLTVTLGGKENMKQPETIEAEKRASGSLERRGSASGRITPRSEYYNEVHHMWMPVPTHWIGTHTADWTHRIYIP